jgi:predicted ribosome quality control (RQC) complex YloA/Tae2 family protein
VPYLPKLTPIPDPFPLYDVRKHIRGVRLESIDQVGTDRVIDMQFGTGERAHHVIVELYAQGNIVLTAHNYAILQLLRSHELGDAKVRKQQHTEAYSSRMKCRTETTNICNSHTTPPQ